MKIIRYTEENTSIPPYYQHFYPDARLLFFDIETTGFAAENTTLYLIGALWYEENSIHIIQWFNEDGYGEGELISAFDLFCKDFTHLVHFNGNGFDLPYLKQKASMLHIPFSADKELTQIDILKEIRPYKKIFALDNMKQVTIERFLEIHRDDMYTGGDLIQIYQRYVARPDEEKEHLLLLHNHDDLLGMPQISQILNYKAFFEKTEPSTITTEVTDTHLILRFQHDNYAFLPKRIAITQDGIYLNAFETTAILQIPILSATLKHFFTDYQNYYYLPAEDTAIHKSVAVYVEQKNRIKATKSTCYVKKTDAFIPCKNPEYPDLFSYERKDKNQYQLLTDITTGDITAARRYIQNILSAFM